MRKTTGITYDKIAAIIFACDIAENLESALEQFKGIYEDLEGQSK